MLTRTAEYSSSAAGLSISPAASEKAYAKFYEKRCEMLETSLIKHCSPTLASLKTANLFSYEYRTKKELRKSVRYWNNQMSCKGIRLVVMKKNKHRALIYVCRISSLENELKKADTAAFLEKYGYDAANARKAVRHLKKRMCSSGGFPHEIGVFLGYPLEDVTGFIENGGKGFVEVGFWKVYGDKEEAEKTFYKYKKCTDIYIRLWECGRRSIGQLTVAA